MFWDELDMVKTKKHEFCEELPNSANENEINRLSKELQVFDTLEAMLKRVLLLSLEL